MRVVLLGPPGSGKGTQAVLIAKHLSVPHISIGDILKANVSRGTPLGRQAKPYLDEGNLVPDDVIINMMRDRLSEPDTSGGFVLDGFPRTVPQAVALDEMLADTHKEIDVVVGLMVDNDEIFRRLSGRRTCANPDCGKIWHVEFDPPTTPDVCDWCGGPLHQRSDDNPTTIANRLDEYATKTMPLIDYYRGQGRLVNVNAAGAAEQITARAIEALEP